MSAGLHFSHHLTQVEKNTVIEWVTDWLRLSGFAVARCTYQSLTHDGCTFQIVHNPDNGFDHTGWQAFQTLAARKFKQVKTEGQGENEVFYDITCNLYTFTLKLVH